VVADDAGEIGEASLERINELPVVAVGRDDQHPVEGCLHLLLVDVGSLPGVVVVKVSEPGDDVHVLVGLHPCPVDGDHEVAGGVQVQAHLHDDDWEWGM